MSASFSGTELQATALKLLAAILNADLRLDKE
jgi:hypothetical protein